MNIKNLLYGGVKYLNPYIRRRIVFCKVKYLLFYPFVFIVLYFISLCIVLLSGLTYLISKNVLDNFNDALEFITFKRFKENINDFFTSASFTIKCKNCGYKYKLLWDKDTTFFDSRGLETMFYEWCRNCKDKDEK